PLVPPAIGGEPMRGAGGIAVASPTVDLGPGLLGDGVGAGPLDGASGGEPGQTGGGGAGRPPPGRTAGGGGGGGENCWSGPGPGRPGCGAGWRWCAHPR